MSEKQDHGHDRQGGHPGTAGTAPGARGDGIPVEVDADGRVAVITRTVSEDMLAAVVGSGSLRVLATPTLCALFERASAELAQRLVGPGETTVGTALEVQHLAPTPLGADVTVTSTLSGRDGRAFTFALQAQDSGGVCARGTHTRVTVDAARFQRRADATLA